MSLLPNDACNDLHDYLTHDTATRHEEGTGKGREEPGRKVETKGRRKGENAGREKGKILLAR